MKRTRAGFEMCEAVASEDAAELRYEILAKSVGLPSILTAQKKSTGYWDVWFEMPTINDSPIVPRLSYREEEVRGAAELFVQIVALPSANRYIIYDAVDTEDALDAAFLVLSCLITLLRISAPRTQSTERIEDSTLNRELGLQGLLYKKSRTPQEQYRVLTSFQKLKAVGYRAFEVGSHEFAIHRLLTGGGVSLQGKHVSIEALENEAQRLERTKSG